MKIYLIIIFLLIFSGIPYAADMSDIKLDELLKTPSAKWGRDPFLRYDEQLKMEPVKEEILEIEVSGIISDGKKAVAIINGGFYRKGDTVLGFTIKAISADKILLEKDDRKFYLGIDRFTRRLQTR